MFRLTLKNEKEMKGNEVRIAKHVGFKFIDVSDVSDIYFIIESERSSQLIMILFIFGGREMLPKILLLYAY